MIVFFIAVFVLLFMEGSQGDVKHVVFFTLVIVFTPDVKAKKRAGLGTALLSSARHASTDKDMLFNIGSGVKCQESLSLLTSFQGTPPSEPGGQLLLFWEDQSELPLDSDLITAGEKKEDDR